MTVAATLAYAEQPAVTAPDDQSLAALFRSFDAKRSRSRTRVLHPTGKSVKTCRALLRKIFRLKRRANQRYKLAHPFPARGAYRDRHETRERTRWTQRRWRAR